MISLKEESSLLLILQMVYDSDGNTLLMKACLEGWDEIVKYLISNYSNIININQQNEVRIFLYFLFLLL